MRREQDAAERARSLREGGAGELPARARTAREQPRARRRLADHGGRDRQRTGDAEDRVVAAAVPTVIGRKQGDVVVRQHLPAGARGRPCQRRLPAAAAAEEQEGVAVPRDGTRVETIAKLRGERSYRTLLKKWVTERLKYEMELISLVKNPRKKKR